MGPKVKLLEKARSTMDRVQAARARKLIESRRATGIPTSQEVLRFLSDLEEMSYDDDDDDDDDDDADEGARGRSKSRDAGDGGSRLSAFRLSSGRLAQLSAARRVVRLSIKRRINSPNPEERPCTHTAEEWCTCNVRIAGYTSTFVDPNQPPYTIWHAGTDFVNLKWGERLVDEEDVSLNLIPVEVFNLTGEDGFCVQVCNYGAQIVSVLMPDHEGLVEEVMPSFPNMNLLHTNAHHYLSGLLGRVCGRVEDGRLRGRGDFDAQLDLNERNQHHLNGGQEAGFDRVPWQAAVAGDELVLTLLLPDGAGGYPGDALLTARYRVRRPNTLALRLTATCTRPCPLAPALRLPLNLAGHGAGKAGVLEHVLKINASHYFVKEKKSDMLMGAERHVGDSVYDLRVPRALSVLHPLAPWPGYRVHLRLDGDAGDAAGAERAERAAASRAGEAEPPDTARAADAAADDEDAPLPFAAKLFHPPSRRGVELRTNQPVLYLETAHVGMPVDAEDMQEELRRAREQRLRAEAAAAAAAALRDLQATAEMVALKGFDAEEKEGEGEDEGDKEDDDDEDDDDGDAVRFTPKAKFVEDKAPRGLAFAENATEYELVEAPPQVMGRGGFAYRRCAAITLQPQREPLIRGKRRADGSRAAMDASQLLLRPGRRLLYAASWRFFVEPPRKRRRRRSPVRYAARGERLEDARARFDMCDFGDFTPPRTPPPPEPSVEEPGVQIAPGDMQADRCSIESLHRLRGRFDRVFQGPPVEQVPAPQRRDASAAPSDVKGALEALLHVTVNTSDVKDLLDGLLSELPDPADTPAAVKTLLDKLFQQPTAQPLGGPFPMPLPLPGPAPAPEEHPATSAAKHVMSHVMDKVAPEAPAPSSALDALPEEQRKSVMERIAGVSALPEKDRAVALDSLGKELRRSIKQRLTSIKDKPKSKEDDKPKRQTLVRGGSLKGSGPQPKTGGSK